MIDRCCGGEWICGPHLDDLKECENVPSEDLRRALRALFRRGVLCEEAEKMAGVTDTYFRRALRRKLAVRAVAVRLLEVMAHRMDILVCAPTQRWSDPADSTYAVAA
jgi:hypothetical protein